MAQQQAHQQELQWEECSHKFMATLLGTPGGNVLAPAQLQLAQRRQASGDLLNNILGGITQGIQLQQLPQQLQEQSLIRQVQTALMQQKLQDLQNPQAALARKLTEELTLKGALNPDLGIRAAEPGLLGQTIGTPSAIGQTEDQLNAAIAANPLLSIPTAAVGAPETPISVFGINTGLTSNPNIPRNALENKTNEQIRLANARAAAQGQPVEYFQQVDGTVGIRPKRIMSGTDPIAGTLKTATGEAAREAPKAGKAGTGALTENAKLAAFGKAAAAGVNPEDPKYFNETTQAPDFVKLVIDTGKAARENKRLADASKAGGLTGKTKSDIEALNAAEKQLHVLQDEITEIAKSGKTPTFLDNIIASETSAPPTGAFSSAWQQLLKGVQGEESKVLEDKKSVISSSLTKAISGLAVSKQEAQRLGFLPRAGESFEESLRKVGLLQDYIDNQRSGLGQGSSVSSPVATPGINPNAPAPIRIGRFTVTPE